MGEWGVWGGSRRNLHPLWRALLHSHTTGDCPSIPPCLLRSSPSLPSLALLPVPLSLLLSYYVLHFIHFYSKHYFTLFFAFFQNVKVISGFTYRGRCVVFDIGSIKIAQFLLKRLVETSVLGFFVLFCSKILN